MKKIFLLITLFFASFICEAQLYGFNENSYPAYDNTAFVDSIAALHPDIIRYPQGKSSSFSDWKSDKPTLPQLAAMQKRVGCDILFVLNMNTSTLAYQIEMLDSAVRLGIPVKYIEFSSEVNNDNSPLRKKFHNNGVEYGNECKVWAATIKAKYPQALFGAWCENKDTSPTWAQDVLSVFTPDAMVTHLYPNDTVISHSTDIIDTAFFRHVIDHSFERAGIDFHLPVWVTEFNLNPDQLKYLKRGQHRIGLLIMLDELQKLGCQMLIVHSLSQGDNGAFEVYKDGTVKFRTTGRAVRAWLRLNHRL